MNMPLKMLYSQYNIWFWVLFLYLNIFVWLRLMTSCILGPGIILWLLAWLCRVLAGWWCRWYIPEEYICTSGEKQCSFFTYLWGRLPLHLGQYCELLDNSSEEEEQLRLGQGLSQTLTSPCKTADYNVLIRAIVSHRWRREWGARLSCIFPQHPESAQAGRWCRLPNSHPGSVKVIRLQCHWQSTERSP